MNYSIDCQANKKFKLASYSEENLKEKTQNNINCLKKILEYNLNKEFSFFRISSEIVPFASHEICKFNWQKHFKKQLEEIGTFIKKHNMRISMHPDQFVLINSPNQEIVKRSIEELEYHADILDLMKLDETAKIQIHVGGAYGNKEEAIKRFIKNYETIPEKIKKRLAIENDDKIFSLKDCLEINKKTKIPIIFDTFHHECLNNNETMKDAIILANKTWQKKDGALMIDYSSQAQGERKGKHTNTINIENFKKIIKIIKQTKTNPDIILEIKDKEKSTEKALEIIKKIKKII